MAIVTPGCKIFHFLEGYPKKAKILEYTTAILTGASAYKEAQVIMAFLESLVRVHLGLNCSLQT